MGFALRLCAGAAAVLLVAPALTANIVSAVMLARELIARRRATIAAE